MNIPISIFMGAVANETGLTWEEIAENWELFAQNWEEGALGLSVNNPFLDLYTNEAITIKDSLKDLSDPSKLFTEYSRDFEVPASKKNNVIFQHYYNVDIVDGYDTRALIPAAITMNGVDYKIGNMSLESINMSNGKPMSYKLRFFGKLSELAKKIGEDKLTALDFSEYNDPAFDAKTEFSNSLERDLVFPLASRSDRYIVDSVNADAAVGLDLARNIRYVDTTRRGEDYGIAEENLIGALRVGRIFDAIENSYGLTFNGAVRADYIENMYLWLVRTDKNRTGSELFKGTASNLTEPTSILYGDTLGSWSASTPDYLRQGVYVAQYDYRIKFRGTSSAEFTLKMLFNGTEVDSTTATTEWSVQRLIDPYTTVTFEAESSGAGTVDIEVIIEEIGHYDTSEAEEYSSTGSISMGGAGEYKISNNLPDMKVSDFMGSVFKMFNLVAEVDLSLNIETKHQEAYMAQGTIKDLSKYIELESYEVSKPNLYNSIKFEFSDAKTVLENGYTKVNGKQYGELSYSLVSNDGTKLSGQEYTLGLKNQRIPVENITDQNDLSFSGITYYQFSDIKGAEQTIKPLFSYIRPVIADNAKAIAWDNGTSIESVSSYVVPSNVYSGHVPLVHGVTPVYAGLYFNEEIEEYTNKAYEGIGLWSMTYRGITAAMFNERRRQVKIKARFTQGVLMNLKLYDILYIHNQYYTINSIDTNFLTGVSVLDLNLVAHSYSPEYLVHDVQVINLQAGVISYIDGTTGLITSQYIDTPGANPTINMIGDIRYHSFEIGVPIVDSLPAVTTTTSSSSTTSITIGGQVTELGQPEATERGFYWVLGTGTPTASDNVITVAGMNINSFSETIGSLPQGTSYTYVVFATNTLGTVISSPVTVTTASDVVASVTSDSVSPTIDGATLYGTVTAQGNPLITSKGFVYMEGAGTPTISNNTATIAGNYTGAYNTSVSGLIQGTSYTMRAFVLQDGVYIYGANISFTTSVGNYGGVITTNTPSPIEPTSATLQGYVSDIGSPGYDTKGFWWTIGIVVPNSANNEILVSGTGAGSFSSSISGLMENQPYSVRTWMYSATNGFTYGNTVHFTTGTSQGLPTLSTYTPTYSHNTASLYGSVDWEGNPAYQNKGFYWMEGTGDPTSANNIYDVTGTGTGFFQSGLINLTPSTTYSVRSFATSSLGTGFGNTVTWTTDAGLVCSPGTLYFDGGTVTGVNGTVGTGSLSWTASQCGTAMTEVSISISNNDSPWQSADQITSVIMKEGGVAIGDYTVTKFFSGGLMQLKINGNFPSVNDDTDKHYTFDIVATGIQLNTMTVNLPSVNAVAHASVNVTNFNDSGHPASRDGSTSNTLCVPIGQDGDDFKYTVTYTADSGYLFTGLGNIQPAPTTSNPAVSVSLDSYSTTQIVITFEGSIQAISESANLSWGGSAVAAPATSVTTQYRFGNSGSWFTVPVAGIDIGTGNNLIQVLVTPNGAWHATQRNTNLFPSFTPTYDYSGDPTILEFNTNTFTGSEPNQSTLVDFFPYGSAIGIEVLRFSYYETF